ncbi:DeoR/GlpR family DNA-binding transcription regulator [Sporolactobacillus laevolacticus]|uniref:DeoR/GlpR family DNA-binding transcription regulator n=1 Tax=Sporolactobacillus laevolacticus TaxID=33018 RepID=UPI0025B57212|nr:DeoR/GlpR family DNA-binding transcription regulator [Sporolactobacillus laevolacticus]MDN3955754.1 DeoR/GlpR family DNA-binding transcription regulator [Sporolactobacillus laevolacticus]
MIIYQEERLVSILAYLKEHRSMSAADICERYEISRDTARRDIVKLVDQGAAIRTHGGIALPDLHNEILAYRDRLQAYSEEKMSIGKKAVSLLHENGCYFLNASTTISCMARQIDTEVTVFTQSLDVAELLSHQSKAEIHLFGGRLNASNRFFFGLESMKQIETIHFDCAFLGTAAITEDGIYYDDQEDAWISNLVSSRSECTVVLAERKKFSRKSRFKSINWSSIDLIITDQRLPDAMESIVVENGTQILIAQ